MTMAITHHTIMPPTPSEKHTLGFKSKNTNMFTLHGHKVCAQTLLVSEETTTYEVTIVLLSKPYLQARSWDTIYTHREFKGEKFYQNCLTYLDFSPCFNSFSSLSHINFNINIKFLNCFNVLRASLNYIYIYISLSNFFLFYFYWDRLFFPGCYSCRFISRH
jgi:hypothetical protein